MDANAVGMGRMETAMRLSLDYSMSHCPVIEDREPYENLAIAICARAVADYRLYMKYGASRYRNEMDAIERFFTGTQFALIMPGLNGRQIITRVKNGSALAKTRREARKTRDELVQARKKKLLDAGLCIVCGKRKHLDGKQKCELCHARWQESFSRWKRDKRASD